MDPWFTLHAYRIQTYSTVYSDAHCSSVAFIHFLLKTRAISPFVFNRRAWLRGERGSRLHSHRIKSTLLDTDTFSLSIVQRAGILILVVTTQFCQLPSGTVVIGGTELGSQN